MRKRTPNVQSFINKPSIAALLLVLLLPVAPAQASEVVKLARLVITGQRSSVELPAPGQRQRSSVRPHAAPAAQGGVGLPASRVTSSSGASGASGASGCQI